MSRKLEPLPLPEASDGHRLQHLGYMDRCLPFSRKTKLCDRELKRCLRHVPLRNTHASLPLHADDTVQRHAKGEAHQDVETKVAIVW